MPAGYKIASKKIIKGEPILKYSVTVGFANVDIEPGAMAHGHRSLSEKSRSTLGERMGDPRVA